MTDEREEGNLYLYRKFEEEDPLRAWFYTELITQLFMKALKPYLESIGFFDEK